MIQLHYHPSNASMAPHILLRELDVPFELRLVDRAARAHKSPDYLRLNPNGSIPVMVDGDLVLYETAAICLHLADTHPQAGLMPPPGTPQRAQAYKWLMWLTNTVQATLLHYFYPERMLDDGNAGGAAQLRAHAQAQVAGLFAQVDAQLASHGGPWMLGRDYSVLDPYTFMVARWTRGFAGPAGAPARERPHVGPFLERMRQRPAVRAALEAEGLPEPWF